MALDLAGALRPRRRAGLDRGLAAPRGPRRRGARLGARRRGVPRRAPRPGARRRGGRRQSPPRRRPRRSEPVERPAQRLRFLEERRQAPRVAGAERRREPGQLRSDGLDREGERSAVSREDELEREGRRTGGEARRVEQARSGELADGPRRLPPPPRARARPTTASGRWLTHVIARSWRAASIARGRAPRDRTNASTSSNDASSLRAVRTSAHGRSAEDSRIGRLDAASAAARHRVAGDEARVDGQGSGRVRDRRLERGAVGEDRAGRERGDLAQERRRLGGRHGRDDEPGAGDRLLEGLGRVDPAPARALPDRARPGPSPRAPAPSATEPPIRPRPTTAARVIGRAPSGAASSSSPGTRTAHAGRSLRAPRRKACRTPLCAVSVFHCSRTRMQRPKRARHRDLSRAEQRDVLPPRQRADRLGRELRVEVVGDREDRAREVLRPDAVALDEDAERARRCARRSPKRRCGRRSWLRALPGWSSWRGLSPTAARGPDAQ